MIPDSSRGLHGVVQGWKCNIPGFVMKRSSSGCGEENEKYFCVVCVSFICLFRRKLPDGKGGQIEILIFFFLTVRKFYCLNF